MRQATAFALFVGLALATSTAHADIVLYTVPGTNLVFVLQGSAGANPGGTITFRHTKFGNLYFGVKDAQIIDAPSSKALVIRRRKQAETKKDVEVCLDAARFALHGGELNEFYLCCSAAWKADKNHPTVLRLIQMKQKMDQPVSFSSEHEKALRDYVKNRSGMRFERSKHFLLLHDTNDKKQGRKRLTRAQERLQLLETVYAAFLMKFCLEGVELEVPKEPLMVCLFAEHSDYLHFVNLLGPSLASAAGFYDRKANISVFYDQGTDKAFDALKAMNRDLQAQKDEIKRRRLRGGKDIIRFADTIQLLTEVSRENLDIEVVSHEATHHMAGNTGLMPGDAPVPVWAAEGLATYFESPKQAAWSGIGAVNSDRLKWYRALEPDREHSNIDFIVSDKIFKYAASHNASLHGYGQAWALTHFLMDKHFDKLIQWYQEIAAIKQEKSLSPEQLQESFDKVFGDSKQTLELEWRRYMRSLKTDLQVVLENADK